MAVLSVASAGVLHHGGHGAGLYAAGPLLAAHGPAHDEGLDYYVSVDKTKQIYLIKNSDKEYLRRRINANKCRGTISWVARIVCVAGIVFTNLFLVFQ